MDRNLFCAKLQQDNQIILNQWYQVTQQLGHISQTIIDLQSIIPPSGPTQIILYNLKLLKQFQINQLVLQYQHLTQKRRQLSGAISILQSRSAIYRHLDHFQPNDYQHYYTDDYISDNSSVESS